MKSSGGFRPRAFCVLDLSPVCFVLRSCVEIILCLAQYHCMVKLRIAMCFVNNLTTIECSMAGCVYWKIDR